MTWYNLRVIPATSEKSQQWPQFLAVLTGCLLAIGSGFQNGWSSPSVPKLLSNDLGFEVTEEQVSYIVMIAPLGFIIGSPLAGILLDKIGRKYTLILLALPEIIPCILIATSNNVPVLYVARLTMGIADGALFTSLPVYMGEVLEPQIRGIVGTCHSLGIMIGNLLINIYGSYVSIRTAACISLSAPLLFLVTFIWMPESPYYLLINNRTEDARKSLKILRRMNKVDDELSQINFDVQRQVSEPGTYRDILTIGTNRKSFLTLIGLRTFQQFSGIIALSFYTQIIFKQAGGDISPAQSAIICCGIQVIVTACGSLLVDRFGRIPLLLTSSIGSAILLIIMGVYFTFQQRYYDMTSFQWLPIVAMVLYYVVGAIGLVMIPNLMAGELLSASVKAKALGIINMYLGLCLSAASKLFQWLDHDFGMHVPFFVFGAWCVVSSVFCYFYVPETKGKTLEEIQQILKNSSGLKSSKTKKDVDNVLQEKYMAKY